jgi:hypothetical protein
LEPPSVSHAAMHEPPDYDNTFAPIRPVGTLLIGLKSQLIVWGQDHQRSKAARR